MKKLLHILFKNRIRKGILLSMALIVTFVSTYMLVLPAITLEKSAAETVSGLVMSRSDSRSDSSESSGGSGDASDGGESGSSDSADGETAVARGETSENEAGETTLSFDAETSASAEDGGTQTIQVHVETSADAFPEGTTMTVEAVTDQSVLDSISDGVEGGVANVSAISVTFNDGNGDEVKPEDTLNVTMSSDAVTAGEESISVVQYTEENTEKPGAVQKADDAETVQELETIPESELQAEPAVEIDQDNAVTFETEDPAVFAIVEKIEENGGPASAGNAEADDGSAADGSAEGTAAAEEPVPSGGEPAAAETAPAASGEESPAEKPVSVLEQIAELVEEAETPMLVTLEAASDDEEEPVKIRAEFMSDVFPEDVRLSVQTVEMKTADEDAAIEAASGTAAADSADVQVRALDITFFVMDEEGNPVEVEPQGEVKISMQADFLEKSSAAEVVHMDDEGNNTLMESATDEETQEVSLTTDGFSVYAIVYTVDFHFKDYAYSIEGGGAVRLSKVFRALDIPVDIAEVEDVTFTDPTLVKVAYKQPVFGTVGDWTLKSLAPFLTEENLHIALKDGTSLDILVTDAQIQASVISAGGENYEITVTYDENAGIPENAELVVTELSEEDEGYQTYYDQTMETVGAVKDASPDDTNTASAEEVPDTDEAPRYARFFDIGIVADGEPVEPRSPVAVTIDLKDAPREEDLAPAVVHFAGDGAETMELRDRNDGGIQFVTDSFSVYSVVYTVDFSFEVDGKTYGFTMQGADTVSLRALIDALHMYELLSAETEGTEQSESDLRVETEVTNAELNEQKAAQNQALDRFMEEIESVTFSDTSLLVPAKVDKDTTAGEIKAELNLRQECPVNLRQDEARELNGKEYKAGDWILISMMPFDTAETLTVTMKNGDAFSIQVTDAQDAVMNGDQVQTIANPAGTKIDLFDYWITSPELIGQQGWPGFNSSQGAEQAGDDKPLNGTGNNQGINSSSKDPNHGHALKFSPAWAGTVYNGNKVGTTGNAWQSVNLDTRNGLNSYTGDEQNWHWNCPKPFTGIVQTNLSNGYPILTKNQEIGTTGESLDYLFDPTINHDGKASYTGVNQLLYVDKEGYYTYDSRDYAAAFNDRTGTFTVTEQTTTDSKKKGFWPFGTENFWTGMHVNTTFSMPANGEVLNPSGEKKPMQFEFSGDDDVWIYVDGILIGDAGGIHNRTEVDINFKTGEVKISEQENKYLDDLFRTGLRDQGKSEAEIEAYITANFVDHVFKTGTEHTFDFFYLERGGGESNLYIHYNLISTADFTAHKSYKSKNIDGTDNKDDVLKRDQFQFELIGYDANGTPAIMPAIEPGGEGTVESPKLERNEEEGYTSLIIGVSEDGNINFGNVDLTNKDFGKTFRYKIREVIPEGAEYVEGHWVKDGVTYDDKVYYFTGEVQETQSGFKLKKTRYLDDQYSVPDTTTQFNSFDNTFRAKAGELEFDKTDSFGVPVGGAEFTLFTDPECRHIAKDGAGQNLVATSASGGKVKFTNIPAPKVYYMKETAAPSGYVLNDTVYQAEIVPSDDQSKSSRLTILGDETGATVTKIINTKQGEISVIKKWVDASGAETDAGSNSITVQLKRKHMVKEETGGEKHTVTIQMTVEDGGVKYGDPVTQQVDGDTIVIEWDDEWQRNFNWNLTIGNESYEGWIGEEVVDEENYKFEQIDIDGRSRRLTIKHADGNVSLTTKYWVNWLHSDDNHWLNLNKPVIIVNETYKPEEDAAFNAGNHTQEITAGNGWAYTWKIGGDPDSYETEHYDLPAVDENGQPYYYYVEESELEGYQTTYSNNDGITEGVITVTNEIDQPNTAEITINKQDEKGRPLAGAWFSLTKDHEDLQSLTTDPQDLTWNTEKHWFQINGDSASLTISDLGDGDYTLTERQAPAGYVISDQPITFTVRAGEVVRTDNVEGTVFTIVNTPGAALPSTGGPGTKAFTISGAVLTVTAVLGYAWKADRLTLRRKA